MAAEVVKTLVDQGVIGHNRFVTYTVTIAADNDYLTSGVSVKNWFLSPTTDNIADGPVIDSNSAGVLTFGTSGAGACNLTIVFN
jgi:lantibiotic modifying enzyme